MTSLDDFPRVALGHWPTPLEPCDRLRSQLGGPRIWLKRDDCSGLAFGGNKTRKLEFLLGDAQAQGSSAIVTFGAVQSNHARQTAAACARLGLPCDLVLTDAVDRPTENYRRSGNRLLDDLFGATVHLVADNDAAIIRAGELAEADAGRYFIDPGGSSAVGALGYVAAGIELAAQLQEQGVEPDSIVVAASTGGTSAGLTVGLAAAGVDAVVRSVAVYADAEHTAGSISRLIDQTAALVGIEAPAPHTWEVEGRALGDGYGIETAESHAAIFALAQAEGVLLDPVYTAKAFGDLLGASSDMDPNGDVVFLHTGGQPGVFAYADAFA